MFCPKCKSEYREGIKSCPVCKIDLIEELPFEEDIHIVAYMEDKELADRFSAFLEYSKIASKTFYVENKESYAVSVESKYKDAATTAFQAFYQVESEKDLFNKIQEQLSKNSEASDEDNAPEAIIIGDDEIILSDDNDSDLEEDGGLIEVNENDDELSTNVKQQLKDAEMAKLIYKPSSVYIKKSDEKNEMFSTAVTFLAFSGALLIFLILNILNLIAFFNNLISRIMIGALVLGCFFVGLNALKRSKKAMADSVVEEKLTSSITSWLETNIKEDFFKNIDSEDMTKETLYLARMEAMKEELTKVFGDIDPDYIDALLEDYYNEHFDNPDDDPLEEGSIQDDVLVEVENDEE